MAILKVILLIGLGALLGLAAARLPLDEAPRLVGDENGGYVLTTERTMAAALDRAGHHCRAYRKYPVLTEVTPKTLGQIKFDCIVYRERSSSAEAGAIYCTAGMATCISNMDGNWRVVKEQCPAGQTLKVTSFSACHSITPVGFASPLSVCQAGCE